MSHIHGNRIHYANHNVVLDPALYATDKQGELEYLTQMAAALTPDGDAKLHKAQLDSFNNDGSWTIEYPTAVLSNFWSSERAERQAELPTRILMQVMLNNGSYLKIIFVGHCDRSKSFQPLWDAAAKHGITIGRAARRKAETEYFKRYDAAVAEHARHKALHQQYQG